MKKIFLALILVLVMIVPVMAFDAGNDFKIEGDVFVGYVLSSSYDMMVNNQIINTIVTSNGSDSKWGYMADVKFTWKNMIRPWIYLMGISGYSTSNSWALETQTFSIGIDYLFYNTKFGSAFMRTGYTNWQSKVNTSFWQVDTIAEPETDTWMVGLGWKF